LSQTEIANKLQVSRASISSDMQYLHNQAKECYSTKLNSLTNATIVDGAIRFVYQKSKENLKPLGNSNEDDKEASNEPDYKRQRSARGKTRSGNWRNNPNNKPSFLKPFTFTVK
jgi:hypothetical protein